jgi:hypothetical protein
MDCDFDIQYTAKELFAMMDLYMNHYNKYTKTNSDEDKQNCITITKNLHEILIHDCNFIQIANDFDAFLDKHIEISQDINYVSLAINYLFKKDFFEFALGINIKNLNGKDKKVFHYNLSLIIINKITLFYKLIEESYSEADDEIKKRMLNMLLADSIEMLTKIYKNIENNDQLVESKETLMELLCSFDLEDIFNKNIENNDQLVESN